MFLSFFAIPVEKEGSLLTEVKWIGKAMFPFTPKSTMPISALD